MCVTSKDSWSKSEFFRALFELLLSTVYINKNIIRSSICFELYMPTAAKIGEDYLVSTYELCEDG